MTIYIQDAFTAADATYLVNHTPVVGGAWLMAGGDDSPTLQIWTNKLRRPTFGEDPSYSTANARAYSDTSLPGTPLEITYTLAFHTQNQSTWQLTRFGDNAGNADTLAYVVFDGTGIPTSVFGIDFEEGTYTFGALDTAYNFRHVITSTTHKLYINDTLVLDQTLAADWFVGPLGIQLSDNNGDATIRADDLLVQTYTPPADPPPQVLSDESQATGKRYFEVSVGGSTGIPRLGVFHDGTDFPADDPLDTDAVMFWKSGSVGAIAVGSTGGTATGASLTPPAINGRVRFAFDIDAGKLYIAIGPDWLGGCDPTLGLNPIVSGLTTQAWQVYAAGDGVNGNTLQIATGAAEFLYEAPLGYDAWSEAGAYEDIPVSPVYTTPLWAFVVGMAYAKNSTRQNLAKSNEFMAMFNTAVGLKSTKQREASPVVNTTGAQ
jgi:hypothetical protein